MTVRWCVVMHGKGIAVAEIVHGTWSSRRLSNSNPFVDVQVKEKVNLAIKGLQQLSAYTSLDQQGTSDWVINAEQKPWG